MLNSSVLRIVSGFVLAVFPASVLATESKAAMLYAHGATTLNGSSVPSSSVVFPGDVVQTDGQSVANINAAGSVVLLGNESLVQYLGGEGLSLKHGLIKVSTSSSLAAHAGDVTVSPANGELTDFAVSSLNGTVRIIASKGNLLITDGQGTTALGQGKETTRDDSSAQTTDNKKKRKKKPAAAATTPGLGAFMNSPITLGVATGAVVGLATWVLVQGDEPASPVK